MKCPEAQENVVLAILCDLLMLKAPRWLLWATDIVKKMDFSCLFVAIECHRISLFASLFHTSW